MTVQCNNYKPGCFHREHFRSKLGDLASRTKRAFHSYQGKPYHCIKMREVRYQDGDFEINGETNNTSLVLKNSDSLLNGEINTDCLLNGDSDIKNLNTCKKPTVLCNLSERNQIANFPDLIKTVFEDITPIAGIVCEVSINNNSQLLKCNQTNGSCITTLYRIQIRDPDDNIIHELICNPDNGNTTVSFIPKAIGQHCICLKALDGTPVVKATILVEGNQPIVSFNYEDEWPKLVEMDHSTGFLYVGYNSRVCCFTKQAEYVRNAVQIREKNVYISDLAISPNGETLGIGLTRWVTERTQSYRDQEIRIYSSRGQLLQTTENCFQQFDVPVVHLTFLDSDTLLVVDRKTLCRYSCTSGVVESRTRIPKLQTGGKVVAKGDTVIIADAARSCICIYDRDCQYLRSFPVKSPTGVKATGLTSVAADDSGYILVVDCISNMVYVYTDKGNMVTCITSEWDFLKWPLDVAIAEDSHVFVADHGNACVKKYKYL